MGGLPDHERYGHQTPEHRLLSSRRSVGATGERDPSESAASHLQSIEHLADVDGREVSTSTQISVPIGSRMSTASLILRSVASPGGRCGSPRRRRRYRSTATSAGTRQSTSTMVVPCRRNSLPTRSVSRRGAIQMSTTTGPVAALRWSASWPSAARRKANACRSPRRAKRSSLIESSDRNDAPSSLASAEASVVFPAPGTPVTTTSISGPLADPMCATCHHYPPHTQLLQRPELPR